VTQPWTPERTITRELAAQVIADQFPELAGQPVAAFDSGWDNVVLAVGDEWVFRFIHRAVALDGAARELAVLTHLADRFDLPVPLPQYVGRPTSEVPWPFWGTRRLPGRELAIAQLPDEHRTHLARQVGSLLRELHEPDLTAQTVAAVAERGLDLPVDPMHRADPAAFVGRTLEQLDRMVTEGTWQPDTEVTHLLERAAALPTPGDEPVLVHGDLHARHLLVDPATGNGTGVIDWGDTALGDPAVDLGIAFGAFAGPARAAFVESYGPIPEDRELRARALAVRLNALLLDYAAAERMTELEEETRLSLRRAVS
jgi:aminoglycoside phosphotransferase (APT) family kinase protein